MMYILIGIVGTVALISISIIVTGLIKQSARSTRNNVNENK